MQLPQVTIIIPTYNRAHILPRALRSVLRQTFAEFKVCVFDNHSEDDTASVVEEFANQDPRIEYHCHSHNLGLPRSVQVAFECVDTPYYCFLSDDDVLLPGFLEMAMRGFREHPDAAYSACETVAIEADSRQVRFTSLRAWKESGYYTNSREMPVSELRLFPFVPAIVFQTAIARQIGPFDIQNRFLDTDFNLRLAFRHPIVIAKHPGAIWVLHSGEFNSTTFDALWPGLLNLESSLLRGLEISAKERAKLEGYVKNLVAFYFSLVARQDICRGNLSDARRGADLLESCCNSRGRARWFRFLAWLSEKCSMVRVIYSKLLNLGDQLDRRFGEQLRLQKEFGHLAEWLDR